MIAEEEMTIEEELMRVRDRRQGVDVIEHPELYLALMQIEYSLLELIIMANSIKGAKK